MIQGKVILKAAGKLGLLVVISALSKMIIEGAKNLLDGKDVLGNKKIVREKTYQDWKGNIILGKEDYQISDG